MAEGQRGDIPVGEQRETEGTGEGGGFLFSFCRIVVGGSNTHCSMR